MNINFAWLTDAFRTPDLRRKMLFTLSMLALYRLGAAVPTPGVDYPAIQQCVELVEGDSLYGVINLFFLNKRFLYHHLYIDIFFEIQKVIRSA